MSICLIDGPSHNEVRHIMNTRLITQAEIISHQQALVSDFHRSRTTFTIAGLRQLFGNTLIALGTQLHGCIEHDRERFGSISPINPAPTA